MDLIIVRRNNVALGGNEVGDDRQRWLRWWD